MEDHNTIVGKRKLLDIDDPGKPPLRGKTSESETSPTDVPADVDEVDDGPLDNKDSRLDSRAETENNDNHGVDDALDIDEGFEIIEIPEAATPLKIPASGTISKAENASLATLLENDMYLSTPDREYLSEFFEHLGVRRTHDLLDIDALEPVQQYIRQALLAYEQEHGSAGGSVRCALGRLVRSLVPESPPEGPQEGKVKAESPRLGASQKKPTAARVARVGAKTWTSRRLPGSAMPTLCPVPIKRRFPNKPSLVGLAIRAHNLKDRKGHCLPEVRWVVDGNQRVGEVVRRWGIDVLKLPEAKLPGGVNGSISDLVDKGIAAHGQSGALPMDARLCKIVECLEPVGGHRGLDIIWPLSILPKDWGVVKESKKQKKDKHCGDCGEPLMFRRCGSDEGVRTFAICEGCDAVKGCFMIRRHAD
eukprot:TRINITY_DN56702_c0_g1_i1.p2 TRINITY_DN56702_c0_g1~~TRINITY_DN56702_c0_g1_i1.p2  ORF type:complete len:420 (-),score=57.79 TRINITY_DN56702_c0_g1_i1:640-1899(-)